jgi:hypothetical protein
MVLRCGLCGPQPTFLYKDIAREAEYTIRIPKFTWIFLNNTDRTDLRLRNNTVSGLHISGGTVQLAMA